MGDRTLNIVGTIGDLVARVARLEALGAARWGSPNPNTARGVVPGGYVSSTSDQTAISGLTDITFATATWTADASRLYRITLSVRPLQVTSTGSQAVIIVTGASGAGTTLVGNDASVVAGNVGTSSLVAFHTASGATSVHARAFTTAGTITIANATAKGWFVVEDAGPL